MATGIRLTRGVGGVEEARWHYYARWTRINIDAADAAAASSSTDGGAGVVEYWATAHASCHCYTTWWRWKDKKCLLHTQAAENNKDYWFNQSWMFVWLMFVYSCVCVLLWAKDAWCSTRHMPCTKEECSVFSPPNTSKDCHKREWRERERRGLWSTWGVINQRDRISLKKIFWSNGKLDSMSESWYLLICKWFHDFSSREWSCQATAQRQILRSILWLFCLLNGKQFYDNHLLM